MSTVLLPLVLCLAGQAASDAAPWPDYRGPGRDGRAAAGARPPLRWGEDENVRWKTPLPGRGWSSPVVAEGRVWLTTADPEGHRLSVLCVDLERGELLLERVLFEVAEPQPRNALNSYASPSPTVEPGRVWLTFGAEGLACLDSRTFELLWTRRDLRCDHMEGPGSSPFVHGERLYLNVDGADVQYVVALDKETGETRWRTARSVALDHLPEDLRKAYSTPIVVSVDGREELISSGAQATVAYDPASGAELWTVRHDGFSMSSRTLFADGVLFLNTGFMRPQLWAVRAGGEGDVTDSHVLWQVTKGLPTMPSPVLREGRIFLVTDGGIVSCLDAATGEERWKERVLGDTCASPVLVGERLVLFDRHGESAVLRAGEPFEELARNHLDSGCMASPAVVGDALIVRTETHLYRLEKSAPAEGER